jgi:hypothetical protein
LSQHQNDLPTRVRPPGMYRSWELFSRGDRVEIWSMDQFMFTAYVDECTEDGQVLWAIEERTGARRLFLRSDYVTLYPA